MDNYEINILRRGGNWKKVRPDDLNNDEINTEQANAILLLWTSFDSVLGFLIPTDESIPEKIYELANSGYIANSERIATMMDEQFENRAKRKSRGVKQAGFVVLYEASMPSVLVELGFLSNPSEQRFLSSKRGQEIMASAIFRAIRDYKVEYERSRKITSSN